MKHCCEQMTYMVEEENSIVFVEKFQEYGVPIRDGGRSVARMLLETSNMTIISLPLEVPGRLIIFR